MIFEKLSTKIGTYGHVTEYYGGFEILVTDAKNFPWLHVFDTLVDSGFQIWVNRKNDHLQIISKPEIN